MACSEWYNLLGFPAWDAGQADKIPPVVDFYNQINLLYGSITEFCSPQTCPEMKATDEYGYPRRNSMKTPTHP